MNSSPTALIYTNRLLPASETFIRDQGRGLKRYRPYYVGCRRVEGLPLPEEQVAVLNEGSVSGSLRELRFKLQGKAPAFYRRLERLQPTLLHAHFGGCAVMALPIVETLDLPFVVTFHGLDATRSAQDRRRQLSLTPQLYLHRRDHLKRRADQFLTVTHYMKQMLVEAGFPEHKVHVHNLGIDTSFFSPDPEVPRDPVVLFVGRLVEKKGCEHLIEAMARVQQQVPEVELVVIGDGPLQGVLEQRAAEHLTKYRFLGRRPPEDVRAWMNRASVFSVPSIIADSGDREGFGIVFLEAQAMGTPAVSFASGGIPEAVAHEETGFLLAERDVEGLAAHIVKLLQDESLWSAMSRRGQERVRSDFDLHTQGRKLEALYDDVVREHQHRAA